MFRFYLLYITLCKMSMEEIKRRRVELESLYTSLKEQVEQILDEEYEAKKRELKEKERQLWKQYDDDDLL